MAGAWRCGRLVKAFWVALCSVHISELMTWSFAQIRFSCSRPGLWLAPTPDGFPLLGSSLQSTALKCHFRVRRVASCDLPIRIQRALAVPA